MFHIQAAPPNCAAFTPSQRLCRAITATLTTASTRIGKCARKPSTTMDQPNAQSTESISTPEKKLKLIPRRSTVSSSTTSHSPRVHRNRDSSLLACPRLHQKNAPIPAVNINVGGQICVIQRVKK